MWRSYSSGLAGLVIIGNPDQGYSMISLPPLASAAPAGAGMVTMLAIRAHRSASEAAMPLLLVFPRLGFRAVN
jgi:hypothetical protein